MNVLVRNTRRDKGIRRRRAASTAFPAVRPSEGAQPQAEDVQPKAVPAAAIVDDGSPTRRHRHGVPQDNAVYNCGCGYVFEAAVTTSVDCPHCGTGQAW
jgi:hypothetical protein